MTATQKDILQAFNLTAANVRKEAGELGKQLSWLVNGGESECNGKEIAGYRDKDIAAGKEDAEAEIGTKRKNR